VLVDSTSATSYGDGGLSANTTYAYNVVAINGQNLAGPPSNQASATTLDASPPTAPSNLSASGVSSTQIALAWGAANDPESGISLYRIYRGGTLIATANSTTFTDAGLAPSTTYSYEVSAVNGAGLEGPRSAPASATTQAPPAGDLIVSVISVGNGIPAAGYQVQVSGTGVLLTQAVGPNAAVSFNGLVAQTYSVLVQGLPVNCVVDDGPNPRSVVVPIGGTVSTSFRVRCN
jgi:chitodextrinase